jgi:hypothetical protein
MKSFVLKEILLLSAMERKARRVKFDPRTTIVLGANDTGKSSLLKSIYRAFGAEPARTHLKWKSAEVYNVVRFSLDGADYSIFQHNKLYAIFDSENHLLNIFTSVTNELGPYLADLFDFKVKLNSKTGESVTPPPAYFFLPFYIDQDSSWVHNWSSFARLQQFSNWKAGLAEYHTGIRPNKYYEFKAESDRLSKEIKEAISELNALEAAKERIKREFPAGTFDVDIESFKVEIERLLTECQELNKIEEKYKEDLISLRNEKTIIGYQIKVIEHAMKEKAADYAFVTDVLIDEHVDCPTCGAVYENSFAERFAIAQDEDRCRDLILQLKQDEIAISKKIDALNVEYLAHRNKFKEVSRILEAKRSEIRLRDVIDSHGKKEVDRLFEEQVTKYKGEIFKKDMELNQYKDSLKHLEEQTKMLRREITNFYIDHMRANLSKLDVLTLAESSYKKVSSNIIEQGSDLPRSLLAYYYSILYTMRNYSSATFCPIVIDSPNQQGQDRESLKKMLRFILEQQPENSQLVLGLEDLSGVEPRGKVIELKTKYGLLRREEYKAIAQELAPLQSIVMESLVRRKADI